MLYPFIHYVEKLLLRINFYNLKCPTNLSVLPVKRYYENLPYKECTLLGKSSTGFYPTRKTFEPIIHNSETFLQLVQLQQIIK